MRPVDGSKLVESYGISKRELTAMATKKYYGKGQWVYTVPLKILIPILEKKRSLGGDL